MDNNEELERIEERDITERDVKLENIDVAGIKTSYNIMFSVFILISVISIIFGIIIIVAAVKAGKEASGVASNSSSQSIYYSSQDVSKYNSITFAIGFLFIFGVPTVVMLIWMAISPIFGMLYDIKLLRYKMVDSSYVERLKKVEKKNALKVIAKETSIYKSGNIGIIIAGDVFQISNNGQIITKGSVKYYLNDQIVLFDEEASKKMTLTKIGDDLQASNGTIYKKVASN